MRLLTAIAPMPRARLLAPAVAAALALLAPTSASAFGRVPETLSQTEPARAAAQAARNGLHLEPTRAQRPDIAVARTEAAEQLATAEAPEKPLQRVTRRSGIQARWYAPKLGRWISPDPLFLQDPGATLKKPLEGSNLYGYVQNNPVNSTDPSGLFFTQQTVDNAGGQKVFELAGPANANNPYEAEARRDLPINRPFYEPVARQTTGPLGGNDAKMSWAYPSGKAEAEGKFFSCLFTTLLAAISGPAVATEAGGARFIATESGVAVHRSQYEMVESLLNAGAKEIGPTSQTTEVGTLLQLESSNGPMQMRVMPGRPGGGPLQGPRTVVTRPGTQEYVRPDGARIEGAVPKDVRKAIGHVHGQKP